MSEAAGSWRGERRSARHPRSDLGVSARGRPDVPVSAEWDRRDACGVELGRPSGTVTFLFTDVENSTEWWDQHPGAMRVALKRHDGILEGAVSAHGGFVFSRVAMARGGVPACG